MADLLASVTALERSANESRGDRLYRLCRLHRQHRVDWLLSRGSASHERHPTRRRPSAGATASRATGASDASGANSAAQSCIKSMSSPLSQHWVHRMQGWPHIVTHPRIAQPDRTQSVRHTTHTAYCWPHPVWFGSMANGSWMGMCMVVVPAIERVEHSVAMLADMGSLVSSQNCSLN